MKVAANSPSEPRKASDTPETNTGLANMRGGSSGSRSRRSCAASTASSASPPSPSAQITGESQGTSSPPQLSSSSQQVTPPISSAAPITSMRAGRRSTLSSLSPRLHSTMARMPSGRLIQNTERQDRCSVM